MSGLQLPEGYSHAPAPDISGQTVPMPKGAVMPDVPDEGIKAPALPTGYELSDDSVMAPVRTPGQRAADWVGKAPGRLADWVGGHRQYDLPELVPAMMRENLDKRISGKAPGATPFSTIKSAQEDPEGVAQSDMMHGIMMAPDDPEAHISLIRKYAPDARFTKDAYGNLIANIGGQRYYTNPSGLTTTDLQGMMEQGMLFGPEVGGLAKAGKAAAGPVGRMLGTGVGFGAANLESQLLSHWYGSEAPLRMGDVAGATVGGMGAEMVATPVAKGINAAIAAMRRPQYYNPDLNLWTPEGRKIVTSAGLDPDKISPDLALQMHLDARQTSVPEAAVRKDLAAGLPKPVSLTAGQATQDRDAISLESLAKQGVYGEEAKNIGNASQASQQAALHGNVPAVQDALSDGTAMVSAPGGGAQTVQSRLIGTRGKMDAGINEAYDAARTASRAPEFDPANPPKTPYQGVPTYGATSMNVLKDRMGQQLSTYDPKTFKTAYNALDDLPGQGGRPATVEELENWRARRVNDAQANPAESGAIGKLIRTYDGELDGALKADLMSGDPAAIQKWRDARALRRRYGQIFGEDDVVNELTSKMSDGSQRLVVDPGQAVNYIFGRGALGADKNLRMNLLKLKSVLGEDSPEWGMLREEGWLRLNQGQDATKPFNAGLYSRNLNGAMVKNEAAMRTLFTPDELNTFRDFGKVAGWVNQVPTSTQNVNPSGSAVTGARIISMFGKIGNLAQGYVTKVLKPGGSPTGARAIQSFAGKLPGPKAPAPGSFAAPGAGMASEPPSLEDLRP